jgi:hypothetical protein
MKRCSKCGTEKPEAQFYEDRRTPSGRRRQCIECEKQRYKEYWQREGGSARALYQAREERSAAKRDMMEAQIATCSKCHETKPFSEFTPDKRARNGCSSWCTECRRADGRSDRQRQYSKKRRRFRSNEDLVADQAYEKRYKQTRRTSNRAAVLIDGAKRRANRKALSFDLDIHKYEIQKRLDRGICEMSGITLNFICPLSYDSPTLDRIDASKGYTYDNVRVVCYAMNVALNKWGEDILRHVVSAWLQIDS